MNMIHPNEPADLSSPPSEPSPPAAFQFAPRHGHVDWGRISALDVDRVVQEVDVGTLQEHMGDITLTNFEGKVCAHCAQPVAPELLKVLRLLQLNMEYLDHRHTCQRAMSRGLQAQLQASLAQQEQAQQKLQCQAAELQALKEENLLQREKINILEQILLYRDSQPFNTCTLCQKSFTNASYLWEHIQKRHLYLSENENQLRNEIKDLRQSLKKAQEELEAQKKEVLWQQQRQRQSQVLAMSPMEVEDLEDYDYDHPQRRTLSCGQQDAGVVSPNTLRALETEEVQEARAVLGRPIRWAWPSGPAVKTQLNPLLLHRGHGSHHPVPSPVPSPSPHPRAHGSSGGQALPVPELSLVRACMPEASQPSTQDPAGQASTFITQLSPVLLRNRISNPSELAPVPTPPLCPRARGSSGAQTPLGPRLSLVRACIPEASQPSTQDPNKDSAEQAATYEQNNIEPARPKKIKKKSRLSKILRCFCWPVQ